MDTNKEYKDKKWLYHEYIVKGKSVNQIRKENGWGVNTIRRWLHYHDIPTRQVGDKRVRQQQSKQKENNPNWKGYSNNNGYVYIYLASHPKANKAGYVSQSRVVAEKKLGRPIKDNEVVHHINGRRNDNREKNLFVCSSRGEHKNLHADIEMLVYKLLERGLVEFKGGQYGFVD